MGVSTDAYLIYGWPVRAWAERHTRPTTEPNEYGDYDEDDDADDDDREEIGLIGDDTPYEVMEHQHSSVPAWIFGFSTTRARAWRGCPVNVANQLATQPSAEEITKARAWADDNKIPIDDGEPAWLLCSYSDY